MRQEKTITRSILSHYSLLISTSWSFEISTTYFTPVNTSASKIKTLNKGKIKGKGHLRTDHEGPDGE